MAHQYWQATENPRDGLEVTHLHEALHAAAGIMLGGWCNWMKTKTVLYNQVHVLPQEGLTYPILCDMLGGP